MDQATSVCNSVNQRLILSEKKRINLSERCSVEILKSATMALSNPKTLSLAAVVSLILVLSHSLEAAGQMQRWLDRFQGLIRIQAINIVIFPALIGLLPMPGGAIFSAPMVKNIGGHGQLNAADLSYVNYWFRHIWEYWWPLYPGVLLITAIGGFNLWSLVLTALPMTVVAVVAGYWPLRGKLSFFNQKPLSAQSAVNLSPLPFIKELTPILIVKGLLEDSQAVDAVSSELLRWGIPLTVVAVTLPMLVGFVSGITIAFVGTTFPILISLIHTSSASHALMPYLILGLVSGFVGVLFSPLHVCLLLSNEYFETSLNQVYRRLLVPCLAMLIAALLYFQILFRL